MNEKLAAALRAVHATALAENAAYQAWSRALADMSVPAAASEALKAKIEAARDEEHAALVAYFEVREKADGRPVAPEEGLRALAAYEKGRAA